MASPDVTDQRSSPRADLKKSRVFYGWVIVATVFIILAVTAGIGFYNVSVILAAATDELDTSVGSVSGGTGLFFAIAGLSSYFLARYMDTVDLRWFFLLGGLSGAGALYGLRWVESVPELYLFFAVFGIGFGAGGLVPATTLVTRWFDRRRPVAISIASTGLSLGGIAITPIAVRIINDNGLGDSGTTLALIWFLGIVPIALLLVRPFPSSIGLTPDGEPPAATEPTQQNAANVEPVLGARYLQARSTRFFIALCVAYLLVFFGQVGGIAQMFNMVLERTNESTAASAISALALASVVARLIGGALVLRLDTRTFTIGVAIFQVMALVSLSLATTSLGLLVSAAMFGISIGNLLMLQPLLLAEAFGVVEYSRIYSSSQLISTIGVAAGPLALGLVRDAADYRVAFIVGAIASLGGAFAVIAAGPTSQPQSLWR